MFAAWLLKIAGLSAIIKHSEISERALCIRGAGGRNVQKDSKVYFIYRRRD